MFPESPRAYQLHEYQKAFGGQPSSDEEESEGKCIVQPLCIIVLINLLGLAGGFTRNSSLPIRSASKSSQNVEGVFYSL